MTYLKRLLRFAFVMGALVAVLTGSIVLAAPQIIDLVSAHHSVHERLSLEPLAERSYIFDSQGNSLGTLINANNENRVRVELDEVPETVVGSVLAAEDASFYDHKGVNVRSIGRAVDANLDSGSVSQGGSTITQQVVKNSLVGTEQDLSRKIREAFLAVELEKQMKERYCEKPVQADCRAGKDAILEYYLNSVYLGGGSYGVQAASEYYFNKNAIDLNWAEGALLAALIRSPNAYDPFTDPDLATERRSIVLKRLVETGRLTQQEADLYGKVPLPTTPNVPKPPNDYFVEEVKQELLNDPKFGLGATPAARNRTVFSGGIRVFTTFDSELQRKAETARNETLPNNQGDATFPVTDPKTGQPVIDKATGQPDFGTQAIVSVEPGTGAVRAMVGGPGFDRYKYNLATQLPGRQPGSSMKTFVLAALFENGSVPSDTVSGGTVSFKIPGQREPYRVSCRGGTGSLTRQTQASNNCAFLRLGQIVGLDKVVEVAKRLGVKSPLEDVNDETGETAIPFSLPLGAKEIRPLDMAAAYATFANDGVYNEPYYVDRIEDSEGKVIYQHQANPEPVLAPQTARLVNATLAANVTGGTGRNARIDSGQPAAGKTGTTNDSADVWFVGYTPELATAIWMGAAGNRIGLANAGLGGATGGRYPAATWGRYYSSIYADRPSVDFIDPEGTRRGKFLGRAPNEIGGSSGTSTRRTTPRTTTPRTTTPTTTPTTVVPTTPTTQPADGGFGGGTGQ
ncbi:MAG TPA: transglycosylase domain-containing protein [Aquihabitans sp.]|nr:transglycosylase domain-containing protein [Aquihabitans sp.]